MNGNFRGRREEGFTLICVCVTRQTTTLQFLLAVGAGLSQKRAADGSNYQRISVIRYFDKATEPLQRALLFQPRALLAPL